MVELIERKGSPIYTIRFGYSELDTIVKALAYYHDYFLIKNFPAGNIIGDEHRLLCSLRDIRDDT